MISVIDLGGTRTKFGLVDKGELIEASHCEARSKGSIETHLDEVADLIADLLVQRGLRFSDCAGIGVSSTGIVDSAGACVLTPTANTKMRWALILRLGRGGAPDSPCASRTMRVPP